MKKYLKEWFKQSHYDYESALCMFKGGRYLYAVFLCHLSIEKILKGIYHYKLKKVPPKTHNLVYLLVELKLSLPEEMNLFITRINQTSIPTRYPEKIDEIKKEYNKIIVKDIMKLTKESLIWLEKNY